MGQLLLASGQTAAPSKRSANYPSVEEVDVALLAAHLTGLVDIRLIGLGATALARVARDHRVLHFRDLAFPRAVGVSWRLLRLAVRRRPVRRLFSRPVGHGCSLT